MAEKADYIIPRLLKLEEEMEKIKEEIRKLKQTIETNAKSV